MVSVPEVISGRSHAFLKVYKALGQFREMVKSLQIVGMNKQKVFQNLHIHILHPNWSPSHLKIM